MKTIHLHPTRQIPWRRPAQFEITEHTREGVQCWMHARGLKLCDYLFPRRLHTSPHLSTRWYARIVHRWVASIGLDDSAYASPSIRRYQCLWPACPSRRLGVAYGSGCADKPWTGS